MSRALLDQLHAEREALREMLNETPVDDIIDRASISAKLSSVEVQIAAVPQVREPARATLTFSGRPVVGSHGILADFGMKAVNGFTEAVAAVAASMVAPLRAMGPIPNREQNQLLITSTALGSFGFELEEYRQGQLALAADASPVEQALHLTQNLLSAAAEADDDTLADSIAELDQRAVDKVRAFVANLADNEALCTFNMQGRVFRFRDSVQVRRTIERMSAGNLHEEPQQIAGHFEGVLPNKRRIFEFRRHDTNDVIVGRISPAVEQPERINDHLGQACTIAVSVTRVGAGRPRYVLTQMPVWPAVRPGSADAPFS